MGGLGFAILLEGTSFWVYIVVAASAAPRELEDHMRSGQQETYQDVGSIAVASSL